MSILVKDMEMPRENELIIISSNGDVEKVKCDGTSWLYDSEAIELPSHGRLIDADAFQKSLSTLLRFPSNLVNGQWIANTIREQPTIIEAEEGE